MESRRYCAICQEPTPTFVQRPFAPALFSGEEDLPLDSRRAFGPGLDLCPGCAQVLSAPVMLAEDAAAFAKAVALHLRVEPASGSAAALAARARLLHRALRLGLRTLVGELEAAPPQPPDRSGPDQLDLFTSRAARLAKVEGSIAEGRLAEAAERAAALAALYDMSEARSLAQCLPQLAARLEALRLDPEALAEAMEKPSELFDPSQLTEPLVAALTRHLSRCVAEAAERRGSLRVRGQPTGWYWLRGNRLAQGRAALEKASTQGVLAGRTLSLLGDIAFGEGRAQAARELYRRAFCEDPGGVNAEALADPAVQALVEDARELELSPPEPWVPLAGWAADLFILPSEPQGQAAARDFHAAVLEARRGGGIEARRRMKRLAPLLFERLRDGGRL